MRPLSPRPLSLWACLLSAACADHAPVVDPGVGGPGGGKADHVSPLPSDWTRGVEHMWLHLDLKDLTGQATLTLEPSESRAVSLEAAGLEVEAVFDDQGPLPFEVRDGGLHVALTGDAREVSIDYRFAVQTPSTGLSDDGTTVIWPTYCGNLFPCRSTPADGVTFDLNVSGYADGVTAIYPERLAAEAPAYTLALAVGDYTCESLGTTGAGTGVRTCWLPGGEDDARLGTADLVAVFDWLETHIGPYTFGSEVASVAVDWGDGAAGGMEHHPYWHVALGEMASPITHAHEAAHGWFGTGVRMACWEDLVLSEGTVSYLAVRALGAVTDADAEQAIWDQYKEDLLWAVEHEDTVVLPASCGEVDLLDDGLWSNVVYMKGAFFFREVANAIGAEALDSVLAGFYRAQVGQAARMTDLLAFIESETGFDPTPLADHWLRTEGDPF